MSTFGTEQQAFIDIHNGRIPSRDKYVGAVSWKKGDTGSANHKMNANPVAALVAIETGNKPVLTSFHDWLRHYAYNTDNMENEARTSNVAYFFAIINGSWSCSLIARHHLGAALVAERMVERIEAELAARVLQASPSAVRAITDHHLDRIGQPFLWIGDGPRVTPIPGFERTLLGAGKRGLVRSGGHGAHTGELEDTLNESVAEVISLVTGIGTVPAYARVVYDAICKRFGPAASTAPYGVRPGLRDAMRRFLRGDGWRDLATVRVLVEAVSKCLPRERFTTIRYVDGSCYVVAWRLADSSTGAVQVDAALADGTRYIGSADTASRSSGGDDPDVDPTEVIETESTFVCRRIAGAIQTREIIVPKPRDASGRLVPELYRHTAGGGECTLAERGAEPMPTPPDSRPYPEPLPPIEEFPAITKLTSTKFLVRDAVARSWIVRKIHYDSNDPEALHRYIIEERGA